jgi:hypothetical protein
MDLSPQPPSYKRAFAAIVFKFIPVLLFVGYLLSLCGDVLVRIHPMAFVAAWLAALAGTMQVTLGDILRELRAYAEWRSAQRRKSTPDI